MPQLVTPTVHVHRSFVAAMEEFRAEGRGTPEDRSMIGRDIRVHGSDWQDAAVFARYVEETRADAWEHTPRPEGFVPCTTLWYVDGDRFLGRIAVRHRLNPVLLEWGGLVGYDVRPTARRRGHATAMLRAALPVARGLGLDEVLVTCDHDNSASRRVIESCGGVLEDRREEKLRYWIRTADSGPAGAPATAE
ncbi:GNAT family N-acetyltransferase [Streptomyces sp. 549]|uniref:GNAT family N-acetyltransferase n=1 Tax=Streptomyces sp. 549 TaxID=3049076 RepID=UPI0024C23639|nr:GNAT family N-acetyltransferase [Streptomyces sp. 549]MDK1474390.1 GNAT family N-acetyltransferase [Streptomyces sp. 549]